MHPLHGETSETERYPSGVEGRVVYAPSETVWSAWRKWCVRLGIAAYIAGACYELWHEDEFRLNVLNFTRIVLQQSALHLGAWGLQVEKSYGDYVSSLH